MEASTIEKLNNLNRNFYEQQAKSFSNTRAVSWTGWYKTAEELALPKTHLKQILDIGCGNGRFVQFLKDNEITFDQYLGVDSSKELIDIACEQYKNEEKVVFETLDILNEDQLKNIPAEQTLIVAFGLIHHIPGYENRLRLIRKIADKLAKDGNLVITFWQFRKSRRFDKMILPNDKFDFKDDLEEGDHLLDWDKLGLPRYCHYFSDEEIIRLKSDLTKVGIKVAKEFSADGKEGDLNKYLMLENA